MGFDRTFLVSFGNEVVFFVERGLVVFFCCVDVVAVTGLRVGNVEDVGFLSFVISLDAIFQAYNKIHEIYDCTNTKSRSSSQNMISATKETG